MGYEYKTNEPMPLALAFLCLPVVLHGDTRRALPKSSLANLNNWLLQNRVATAGFGSRARSMLPYTREALLFGAARGVLQVTAEGLRVAGITPAKLSRQSTELQEYAKAARNLGMWFAAAGSPSTIYALWGVAP